MSNTAKFSFVCEPPAVAQCHIDPNIPPNPLLPGNNVVCVCVPPVTVSCVPPLLWHNGPACDCPTPGEVVIGVVDGRAICSPPAPPRCELKLEYTVGHPTSAQLLEAPPHCDDVAIGIAVASALARWLAGR